MKRRSPVSIVICAYNGLEYTKLLLWSIREHSKLDHEVIVYSDGSSDATLAWLREQSGIQWRHDRVNRGICTAMNRAAKLATREYLFFPNTDQVLAPGWDEALAKRLSPRRVVSLQCIEPGVVPVAPVFHAVNCGARYDEFDPECFKTAARQLSRDKATPGINYPFVISRALWDEVGGLDELFNPGPANDPDLWYRLRFLGAEMVRAEDVIVYHFSGKSSRMAGEAVIERPEWHEVTVRNEARFVEKWGEPYQYANGGLPDPGPGAQRRWEERFRPRGARTEVASPVHVLFDARAVTAEAQGIGVYAENLMRAMSRRADARVHVAASTPDVVRARLGSGTTATVHALTDVTFANLVSATGAHVFHGPSFSLPEKVGVPAVITIHDVLFKRHPEWYPESFVRVMEADVRRSIDAAEGIIAVSEATREDAIRLLAAPAGKVRRIYEACPEDAVGWKAAAKERVREKLAAGAPYILAIGVQQRRKNAPGLLRACAELKQAGRLPCRIVLAGGRNCEDATLAAELERLALASDITLTSHLPRTELLDLLANAELLVYPSLAEGFGLPLLEAMACGVPIACASAPSLPEVAGDAARLFDPEDAGAMATAIDEVLSDRAKAEELVARGHAQLAKFSWATAARETLEVYGDAIKKHRDIGTITSEPPAAPKGPLRVAVDARLLGADRLGTGRYTSEILRAMMREPRAAEFVLIGPRAIDTERLPNAEEKVLQTVPAEGETLLNGVWEQFSLPTHLLGCDVYFAPTGIVPVARSCRAVTVVHDLGVEDHPEYYAPRLREHLKRWLANSCRSADRLIAVSQFTAYRVAERYGVAADRIDVIHHGFTGSLSGGDSPDDPDETRPLYVLCVSSFEANKNLLALIEAFATLDGFASARLVLAGRKGDDLERVRATIKERGARVDVIVDPDDTALGHLYRHACVFAYPSLYEGFGLPLVEAMSAGLPVLTGRVASCAEVVGDAGVVVNDVSVGSLRTGLERLLKDPALREELARKARERASEFTWERAARATWESIDRCLEA